MISIRKEPCTIQGYYDFYAQKSPVQYRAIMISIRKRALYNTGLLRFLCAQEPCTIQGYYDFYAQKSPVQYRAIMISIRKRALYNTGLL